MKYGNIIHPNLNCRIKKGTKSVVALGGLFEGVEFHVRKFKFGRGHRYSFKTKYFGITVSLSDSYGYKMENDKSKIEFVKEVLENNTLMKFTPVLDKAMDYMSDEQSQKIYLFVDEVNHALQTLTPSLLPGEKRAAKMLETIKAAQTSKKLEEI